MLKSTQTKERIVQTALTQAVSSGLVGLSFGTLADSAGLSKSGLFAHFASKDDLQKAVLERATELFMQKVVAPAIPEPAGRDRLKALYANYLDWITGDRERPGCPFVTFVQEFDDRSGAVRDLLLEAQVAWRKLLSDTVRQAQQRKQIVRKTPPNQIAFELIGAALSFQTSLKMIGDKRARRRALTAFNHILN